VLRELRSREPSTTYRFIADDPDRLAGLIKVWSSLGQRFDLGTGSTVLDWSI
jgi:hypothetical protein